jgi:glycosyltransferase 2 family protein
MAKSHRARLLFAAKLVFSALLLWVVLRKLNYQDIAGRLRAANPRWLALALLSSPVVMALSAKRWQVLSQGLLTFGRAFRYTWIGLFFGSIMPGMVSGDIAKGFSLAAKSADARDERLPISILFDKLVGLWVLLALFCVVALILLATHSETMAGMRHLVIVGIIGTLLGLMAGVGIMHPAGSGLARRLIGKLPVRVLASFGGRALDAVEVYAAQPWRIAQALALSLASHGLNCVSFWLVLRALAIPAGLPFAAVLYPMLSLLLAVPVSVSGIGVRDVFIFSLFKTFGLNPASGVAFSWLLLGLSVPIVAIGGLIQLGEVFRRR